MDLDGNFSEAWRVAQWVTTHFFGVDLIKDGSPEEEEDFT